MRAIIGMMLVLQSFPYTPAGCTWSAKSLKFGVSPCSSKLISLPPIALTGGWLAQGSHRFYCTNEFSTDSADFDIRYASVNRDSELAHPFPTRSPVVT